MYKPNHNASPSRSSSYSSGYRTSTTSNSGGRNFSKPSSSRFGSSSSSSRFGGSRGGSRFGGGNRRSFSSRGRGFQSSRISSDKYVFKAPDIVESAKYEPKHKFSDFDIIDGLKKNIEKRGYVFPAKIQDETIPLIIEGRDVIGLASTGSGKTAAFLIPMISKVFKNHTQRVLIIAPTRELATQIDDEFRIFAAGSGLRSTIVIGGASMRNQIYDLKRDPQFVIGTPGRIKDLFEQDYLRLEGFNNIILDEVDRMLDMGFIDDIRTIISKLQRYRQSLFFSATMSHEANLVANTLLLNPVKVESGTQSSSKNVDQDVVRVKPMENKVEVLHEILIKEGVEKVLIFSKTKHGADKLTRELVERGFKADSIHGDKPQAKRDRVIASFKQDRIKILVATDVAARGLDVPDISHVINYDEPATFDDYIHRIGRTGRYNKKGKALTFVS